jgi:thiol-disulfide isomerase/thioredoxin
MSWIVHNFRRSLIAALCMVAVSAPAGSIQKGDDIGALLRSHLNERLPDIKGKVVLVDFWASWCAPCRRSFPEFDKLLNEYKDRGFMIVAINVDEDEKEMQNFLKKLPVTFTVVHDERQALVAAVDVDALPTSLMLDRDGKLRSVHNGFKGEETIDALRKEIEDLLQEARE